MATQCRENDRQSVRAHTRKCIGKIGAHPCFESSQVGASSVLEEAYEIT